MKPAREEEEQVTAMEQAPEEGDGMKCQGEVRSEKLKCSNDVECHIHSWFPSESAHAVVILFHGVNGHGLFPSVRYLAQLLVDNSYLVYCMDFCGHGKSEGMPGLLPSSATVLDDARVLCKKVREEHNDLPSFLAGVSMGGSVALLMSLELDYIQGLILLAPMISLPLASWQKWLVGRLAQWIPHFGLSKPSAEALKYSFRDEERRMEVVNDEHKYMGRMRAATAHTCIELASSVSDRLSEFSAPMLCLLATEDYVIDNHGIDALMDKSLSADKTLKEYEAYHGLMCEIQPVRNQIESDIVSWMAEHTK